MSPAARGPACPPFRPAADEGGVWRCWLRSAKNRPRLPAAGFLTFVLANGRAGPRPSVPWGPRGVRPDAERRPSRPCLFGEQSHRLSVTASRSRGAPSRMTKAQQSGESLPPEGHPPPQRAVGTERGGEPGRCEAPPRPGPEHGPQSHPPACAPTSLGSLVWSGLSAQGSARGHSGTEAHVPSCHVHLRTLPSTLPFSVAAAHVFECCAPGALPGLTEQVWAGGAGGC